MKKFEYKVVTFGNKDVWNIKAKKANKNPFSFKIEETSDDKLEEILNQLGLDGWELVIHDPIHLLYAGSKKPWRSFLVFKRELK
jgi:hypothetical protein